MTPGTMLSHVLAILLAAIGTGAFLLLGIPLAV